MRVDVLEMNQKLKKETVMEINRKTCMNSFYRYNKRVNYINWCKQPIFWGWV